MRKVISLAVIMILVFGFSIAVNAQGYTAKSLGMGNAFTAVADDVSAVFYNPAGLTQSGFVGLQGSAGVTAPGMGKFQDVFKLAEDIEKFEGNQDDFYKLMGSIPENLGASAMGFGGANFKAIGLSGNVNTDFRSWKEDNETGVENEMLMEGGLTIGQELISPPMGAGTISYGANLRMGQMQKNEYVIEEENNNIFKNVVSASDRGYGVDAGVLAKLTDIVTVGAQVRNIVATEYTPEGTEERYEYDIEDENWGDPTEEDYTADSYQPMRNLRAGAAVQIPIIGTTIAADLDNLPPLTAGDKEMAYHLGVEQNLFFNALSLRGGAYGDFADLEEGENRTYTAGIGFNLVKFHVDAAVASQDMFEDDITAVLSGRFKF